MLGIGAKHAQPTILLIDDDMVSREVTATILTMSGYTIHTAPGGAESLAVLDAVICTPDVILMDTQMPGLSGAALVAELRSRSKAALYAMSASEAPAELLAIVDGFLEKPFTVADLEALLYQRTPPKTLDLNSDQPVVSAKILGQLRELMSEAAVREIYKVVVADLDHRTVILRMAIARGDVSEIRRIGHSIKGGCGMAGAVEAARLGALLEEKSNHLDDSQTILLELQAAARNLERMLEDEFPA